MNYGLLSLLITLAIGRTGYASALEQSQKIHILQQGGQQQATLLPMQQPACANLLDASELHGEWVEGTPDMQAGPHPCSSKCIKSLCMRSSKGCVKSSCI